MAEDTPETYNWVRVNVMGDGNCFYRSLYQAARLHWIPEVLDDLLRCLGLTRAQIETPVAAVTAPPASGTRRIRRIGGAKTAKENAAEDRFCRLARSALAAKVRDASGQLLDEMGADSPYNELLGLKNQLFELQFGNPTNILKGLYEDIQTELTSNVPSEPIGPEFIESMMLDLYKGYFDESTPPEIIERLTLQAKIAYEVDKGIRTYEENTDFKQPENYLRDDLTLGDFPTSFRDSLADTWIVFLESMSAGFRRVFRDFTKFPKSNAEFTTKYATILEKYGEFTTDIDIRVLNALLARCNLRVHVASSDSQIRAQTPAPQQPIYVMLDADGEHYNFLIVPSKYEEAPAEYDLYGGYTPEPQFYSDGELFMDDSTRIHGDSEPEVRVKLTEEEEEVEDNNNNLARLLANSSNNNNNNNNNNNATLRATLASLGLKPGDPNYENTRTAIKASFHGGRRVNKKRRVTRKKRRV